MAAARQHRAILQAIARRVMLERGLLPDFSAAALAEVHALRAAGERSGERAWPLPLYDEYTEDIQSEVADLKNMGGRGGGGALTAAAFLKAFAGTHRWAHLDIAGTAWVEKDRDYLKTGAAGFLAPILTGLRYLIFAALIYLFLKLGLGGVWGLLVGVSVGIAAYLVVQWRYARNRRSGQV